jgi:hypothetical protein
VVRVPAAGGPEAEEDKKSLWGMVWVYGLDQAALPNFS